MWAQMNLRGRWQKLDGRNRVMAIATALLAIPLFGQLVSLRDKVTVGHNSVLALLLLAATVFIAPTSLILSLVVASTVRADWRRHLGLLVLAAVDLLVIAFVIWYFFSPCGWIHAFGIASRYCR